MVVTIVIIVTVEKAEISGVTAIVYEIRVTGNILSLTVLSSG